MTPETMSRADLDLVYREFQDHGAFCRSSLVVETEQKQLVPMVLGPGQLRLAAAIKKQRARGVPVRLIYLKSRRIQATTGTAAHFFRDTAFQAGVHTAVIAHDDVSTQYIFSIYKRFYEKYKPFAGVIRLPPSAGAKGSKIAFEYAGEKESSFIQVNTAGSTNFGRGFRLTNVHFSEFPYYPKAAELLAAVMSAVPKTPDTTAVIEGTAKTIGDAFHKMWQAAMDPSSDSEWLGLFMGWWEHPSNAMPVHDAERFANSMTADERAIRGQFGLTDEQLAWRRWTLANDFAGDTVRFQREHPACVTAETLVSTDRGLIPICEVSKADSVTESGKIVAFGPQPASEIYKLTLKSGRTLRGTNDHPVSLKVGGFKGIADLAPGEIVNLRPPIFARDQYSLSWNDIPGYASTVSIDADWAAFLGFFMGDGSWHKGTIDFACDAQDPDVVETLSRLMLRLFGSLPKSRTISRTKGRKGMTNLRLGCTPARDVLWQLGSIHRNDAGEGSWVRSVCVPDCILRSPRPIVREFLKALFECDGSSGKADGVVKFSSCKFNFIQDVQLLLLGFGINSAFVEKTKVAGDGHSYIWYELVLKATASRMFHDLIGFVGARKSAQRAPGTGKGRPPDANCLEDQVLSVEPDGFDVTYDLTIEGEHVFSANGILTHNTPEEAFTASSRNRFSVPHIQRMPVQRDPLVGELVEDPIGVEKRLVFLPGEHGALRVWRRPERGRLYVAGADCAQGLDVGPGDGQSDPDYSATQVLDRDTGEQVAVLRARLMPGETGRYNARLCAWYGMAQLVGERNPGGGGVSMLEAMLNANYPSGLLYHRSVTPDQDPQVRGDRVGWDTSGVSRPLLLGYLDEAIRQGSLAIHDEITITELLTFVIGPSGKAEAQRGCHDDLVIALALAVVGILRMPRPVAREAQKAPVVQRYGQAPDADRRGVNTRVR